VKVRNKLVSVFDKLHTISRKLTGRDPINLFNFNLNKMETADALTELSQIVKTPPEKLPVISPEFCEVISALIPPKAQKLLNILQIDEYSKLGRLNLIQEDSSLMKSTNLGSYIHTSNARSAKNHTIFRSLIELEKLALNTNNRSKLRDEVYNTTIKYYDLLNGAFGKNTIKVLESLNLKTLKDIQVMDSNKESMLVELLEVKKAERSLAEILKIVDIINLLAQAD
jgi:DNA-binding protein Fis